MEINFSSEHEKRATRSPLVRPKTSGHWRQEVELSPDADRDQQHVGRHEGTRPQAALRCPLRPQNNSSSLRNSGKYGQISKFVIQVLDSKF